MSDHIYVTKRNGDRVPVSFNEVLTRIQKLADGLSHVNPDLVAQKVCTQIQDGIKTSDLDEFAAEVCAMMQARHHPNYGKLAARLVIDNHQKKAPARLIDSAQVLFDEGVISEEYYKVAQDLDLESMIVYSRDFMFEYFGFKTLENGYLLRRRDGRIWESPQHMWMRVAIQLHGTNVEKVKETYDALSMGYFIHATPTLFNAGTRHAQLSSCFLVEMESDSIRGIYDTLGECAQISKWAGGVGLSIHDIRARGSDIKGTNGKSTGIVPMLKVFNDTAKYVNQGGKRNGSFAIYLEPWHADIEEFLRLKLNTGAEEDRARDLFYGLWISDLFMERVEKDEAWSLMSPDQCPGLSDCWGDEFNRLYTTYERDRKFMKQIPAKKLWQMIIDAQIQTGTPYLLYKDACNAKSNQQNRGTIKSSNLCVAPETLVLTDKGQFPIHTLAGESVRVWNGDVFSEAKITKTGVDQELVDVELSDGRVLTCTPYHKFLVTEGYTDKRSVADALRVDASDLKTGMKLFPYKLPSTLDVINLTVVQVINRGRRDDTYCFNEPINHAGTFNGILTGNCAEIIEYTSSEETAVCNLGSLALPKFVERSYAHDGEYRFNFDLLRKYTAILARNLDIVIDTTYYPTDKCKTSNLRNRPIGIGVQGLADVFAMLRLPWSSEGAAKLNREIFENIYYAAATTSMLGSSSDTWRTVSLDDGKAYPTFEGSPMSQGKMQFDLWNETPVSTYLQWDKLRTLCKGGMRNSLLIALMPTASTSQILGNNECFEPFTSNLYTRRVLSGDFVVVNKYLVEDLVARGMWIPEIRTEIIANNGSIQSMIGLPGELRELYRTAWEIPMKTVINMARDRAPFVCQSQSLNLFIADPTYSKLSSMHFYAWKQGLKTGCYYLRTKAAAKAQQFTVEPSACVTCSA
jgi:ribonucleotide reductase alpha subunit